MKKSLIKLSVFVLVFIVALLGFGTIMNRGQNNLTMEMGEATLPVVGFLQNGVEINQLHGYTTEMDPAFQRDTILVLGENRNADFYIDTYGRNIMGVSMEIRSIDGSRLIEETELTEFKTNRTRITGSLALKDLIEAGEEYELILLLEPEDGDVIRYYTRCIWAEDLYVQEKVDFVVDFHNRLFDAEKAKELTRYLETNSKLEDNSSFHRVNIHSSLKQLTYGDLNVTREWSPVIQITEMTNQTASFVMKFLVSTSVEREKTYYYVEEYYRIRYTTTRTYLLDYERTMTQIPNVKDMYANDKILLGITNPDMDLVESKDGNIVVFQVANKLMSYNVTGNKLAVLFSFYSEEHMDIRTLWQQHGIKILDVAEGGNVQFAVYGYMNRGRNEGKVGIQIYHYDSALNTIEEIVYIPYDKSYEVLQEEMDTLLYLNRDQKLYLALENVVYSINLSERTIKEVTHISQDGAMFVSDNHETMVWLEGEDVNHSRKLNIRNMTNDVQMSIEVEEGQRIYPMGFMGEDIIYGVAYEADIIEERTGQLFIPMYKVCISNTQGITLKEYIREGIYITQCSVEDNQITLERCARNENGRFEEVEPDSITNNEEQDSKKNTISVAAIDIYEEYVQIKVRKSIDRKTLKVQTPKELVFEGGRELIWDLEDAERYYVYGHGGVQEIFCMPAGAINLAYDIAGVVVNHHGDTIWYRGNRATRNQIMAIKEAEVTETKNSLTVCLDTIFGFEGMVRNSEYLLAQGDSVVEILQENLEDCKVLNLTGCPLDALLYYVNQDIPVLAMVENGEAVLVTGFNEFNVVIMEPTTGRLYKKGMNDSTQWFGENGNCFITYSRE